MPRGLSGGNSLGLGTGTSFFRPGWLLPDALELGTFRALPVATLMGTTTVGALFVLRLGRGAVGRSVSLSAVSTARLDVAVPGTMPEAEAVLALRDISVAATVWLPANDDREQRANRLQRIQRHRSLLEVHQIKRIWVLLHIFVPSLDAVDGGWDQLVPVDDFIFDFLGILVRQAPDYRLEGLLAGDVVREEFHFVLLQNLGNVVVLPPSASCCTASANGSPTQGKSTTQHFLIPSVR